MDFVVSSKIENQFVDEITLALWHIDDIKNKINLNNAITCMTDSIMPQKSC